MDFYRQDFHRQVLIMEIDCAICNYFDQCDDHVEVVTRCVVAMQWLLVLLVSLAVIAWSSAKAYKLMAMVISNLLWFAGASFACVFWILVYWIGETLARLLLTPPPPPPSSSGPETDEDIFTSDGGANTVDSAVTSLSPPPPPSPPLSPSPPPPAPQSQVTQPKQSKRRLAYTNVDCTKCGSSHVDFEQCQSQLMVSCRCRQALLRRLRQEREDEDGPRPAEPFMSKFNLASSLFDFPVAADAPTSLESLVAPPVLSPVPAVVSPPAAVPVASDPPASPGPTPVVDLPQVPAALSPPPTPAPTQPSISQRQSLAPTPASDDTSRSEGTGKEPWISSKTTSSKHSAPSTFGTGWEHEWREQAQEPGVTFEWVEKDDEEQDDDDLMDHVEEALSDPSKVTPDVHNIVFLMMRYFKPHNYWLVRQSAPSPSHTPPLAVQTSVQDVGTLSNTQATQATVPSSTISPPAQVIDQTALDISNTAAEPDTRSLENVTGNDNGNQPVSSEQEQQPQQQEPDFELTPDADFAEFEEPSEESANNLPLGPSWQQLDEKLNNMTKGEFMKEMEVWDNVSEAQLNQFKLQEAVSQATPGVDMVSREQSDMIQQPFLEPQQPAATTLGIQSESLYQNQTEQDVDMSPNTALGVDMADSDDSLGAQPTVLEQQHQLQSHYPFVSGVEDTMRSDDQTADSNMDGTDTLPSDNGDFFNSQNKMCEDHDFNTPVDTLNISAFATTSTTLNAGGFAVQDNELMISENANEAQQEQLQSQLPAESTVDHDMLANDLPEDSNMDDAETSFVETSNLPSPGFPVSSNIHSGITSGFMLPGALPSGPTGQPASDKDNSFSNNTQQNIDPMILADTNGGITLAEARARQNLRTQQDVQASNDAVLQNSSTEHAEDEAMSDEIDPPQNQQDVRPESDVGVQHNSNAEQVGNYRMNGMDSQPSTQIVPTPMSDARQSGFQHSFTNNFASTLSIPRTQPHRGNVNVRSRPILTPRSGRSRTTRVQNNDQAEPVFAAQPKNDSKELLAKARADVRDPDDDSDVEVTADDSVLSAPQRPAANTRPPVQTSQQVAGPAAPSISKLHPPQGQASSSSPQNVPQAQRALPPWANLFQSPAAPSPNQVYNPSRSSGQQSHNAFAAPPMSQAQTSQTQASSMAQSSASPSQNILVLPANPSRVQSSQTPVHSTQQQPTSSQAAPPSSFTQQTQHPPAVIGLLPNPLLGMTTADAEAEAVKYIAKIYDGIATFRRVNKLDAPDADWRNLKTYWQQYMPNIFNQFNHIAEWISSNPNVDRAKLRSTVLQYRNGVSIAHEQVQDALRNGINSCGADSEPAKAYAALMRLIDAVRQ